MDRRRSRGPMRPVSLTGSTRDNSVPLPSTTANSGDDVYTVEYRSAIARDYKKTVTFRKGVLVHNEYAKDWDRDAPHPTYESSYGGYRHERIRGNRSRASDHYKSSKATQGSRGSPLKDSTFPEQLHSKSSEKVASSTEVPPPQKLSPCLSTQESIVGSQEGPGATLFNAQEVSEGEVNTSPDLDKQSGSPSIPLNLESREYILDAELIDRTPSRGVDDKNIIFPVLDTKDRRHSQEVSIRPVDNHKTASIRRQQDESVKIPLSFLRKVFQATVSPQMLASVGIPRCDVFALGSIDRPMSSCSHCPEDSRSNNSLSDASSLSDCQSQFSSALSTSGRSDGASLDGSSITSDSLTIPEEFTRVPPAGASHYLPCEFHGYRLCNEWFPVEDTHSWSEHVITDHLQNFLPSKCSCWFCDDIVFDSEKSGIGRHANFMWRMEHIRGHFLDDGCAVDHIRIDCHFLNHIWKLGIITPKVYKAASKWMEGPSSGISGFYAHDFEPLEMLQRSESSDWIKTDQRREIHDMFKEGCDNIKFRRQALRVKAIHGKTPSSTPDTDQTHECHEVCEDIIIHDNSVLSYSSGDDKLPGADLLHSRFGGSDTLSAIDTRPTSRKSSMSARVVDIPLSKQDLDELCTRFSQVAISGHSLTRNCSNDEKLESGQGSNHQSNESSTDHLHAPPHSVISRWSQSTTPILTAPAGTTDDIPSLARPSIEFLGPRIELSPEIAREHTASSNDQPSSSGTSPSAGSQVVQPSPGPGGPVRSEKRKRPAQDSDKEESDEELAPVNTKKGKSAEKPPPFACPYFKHDQVKYRDTRYCNGPGWPTVHRVKEHLYRRHRPKRCRRCWATFQADEELTSHLQQDSPCHRREEVPVEGLSDAQEKKLRARDTIKKLVNGSGSKQRQSRSVKVTEYEKWRKVYTILFPEVDEHEIPSPYYDSVDPSASLISDAIVKRETELCQNLPTHLVRWVVGILEANNVEYDERLLYEQCKIVLNEGICTQTADGIHHASEIPEATTEDPLIQSSRQAEAPTSTPVYDTGIPALEYGDPFIPLDGEYDLLPIISAPDPQLSGILGLDPSSPRMDHLGASSTLQQPTDAEKWFEDSGYGSGGYQNDRPWLWFEDEG